MWSVPDVNHVSGTDHMLLAERTGLEPATLGVTGRYSNQLNYRSNTTKSGVPRGIRTPVLTVKG